MNYEEALKTIERRDLKPVRLEFGKRKKFQGVEFTAIRREPYINWLGVWVDPRTSYNSWIFVNCGQKYVDYLDNHFFGKNFIIYGESHGDDFIIMGKSNKERTYKNPKVNIINL